MSTTAIESWTPSVVRTTAQRVAEGVVAAYIHSLASSPAETADAEPTDLSFQIGQAAAAPLGGGLARGCERGRRSRPTAAGAVSIRRRPAQRRVLLPA